MNRFLNSVVAWLRAGYPEGIPPTDYAPVLALLSRRLSNDEVKVVARELMSRGDFDHVDIGVLITQITDELPAPTGPGIANNYRATIRQNTKADKFNVKLDQKFSDKLTLCARSPSWRAAGPSVMNVD